MKNKLNFLSLFLLIFGFAISLIIAKSTVKSSSNIVESSIFSKLNKNVFEIVEDENIEHLSLSEGLSQGTVKCILQDSKGFLWFGTQNGLNRYDGYSFRIFTNNIDDSTSISDNNIEKIAEDPEGNLWIATSNGLNKFNRKTESFEKYYFGSNRDELSTTKNFNSSANNYIYEISYNKQQDPKYIWLGVKNGLVQFDLKTKQSKLLKVTETDSYVTHCIADDHKGNLILALNYNNDAATVILKFNKKTQKFSSIREIDEMIGKEKNQFVSKLYFDSRGNLWVATNKQCYCFDLDANTAIQDYYDFIPKKILVNDIFEDNEANLWFTTNLEGLWKIDLKRKKVFARQNDPTQTNTVSYNTLLSGYFDRNNNIWIGTNGLGVDKLSSFSNRFNLVKGGTKNCNIKSIRKIIEDNYKNIWLSGYNGFTLFKSNNKRLIDLTKDNPSFFFYPMKGANQKLLKSLRAESDAKGLNHKYLDVLTSLIYSYANDKFSKNEIWFGTEGSGLFKFYINDLIFELIPTDKGEKSIQGSFIYSLICDNDGIVWCGSEKGLNRFNRAKNEYNFYGNNSDSNSISQGEVKVVYQDKKGEIWVGTNIGGLNRLDTKSGKFKHYMFNKNIKNCISSNSILSIYEDSKNRFWIGTNNGLNLMDRKTGKFKLYTIENGLPNNTIYGILEDSSSCLWLSTNKGLSRFNPEMGNFYNFSSKDGLQHDEFNTAAYLKTENGEFYFGGVNGFNHFYPSEVFNSSIDSKIVLTDLSIFNKYIKIGEKFKDRVILPDAINETKEITLNYDENMITIEYSLLSFCNPGKIKYKYKLKNFKDEWILTNDRKVTFTNLDPGEYVFTVIGSSNENIWSKEEATIKIIIKPPFWQTWWFRCLVAIVVISSIYLLYRLRIRDIKKRQIELEQIVEERTKDLKIEKEKTEMLYKKSENLLLNVLPEPIAKRLKDGEALIADQFEEASVVFIDIVDFTKLSMNSNANDMVNMLNDIFSIFDRISAKYGLEKIKTIGDCYMAAAGIPIPMANHAEAISGMAVEAVDAMKGFLTPDGQEIKFRVGLDCGPTIAGVIGKQKFIYDLWGDMVNTASRMETSGVAGRIQCTERFKNQLERGSNASGVIFEERGMIEIKGKGQVMTYLLKS